MHVGTVVTFAPEVDSCMCSSPARVCVIFSLSVCVVCLTCPWIVILYLFVSLLHFGTGGNCDTHPEFSVSRRQKPFQNFLQSFSRFHNSWHFGDTTFLHSSKSSSGSGSSSSVTKKDLWERWRQSDKKEESEKRKKMQEKREEIKFESSAGGNLREEWE